MTLPLNSRLSALYDTNGTQKEFSFGFRVFFDPDNGGYGLEVRRQTADGYEVIPKSDYLVLPVEDNSAGVVRFSVAPSAGQQIYIAGKTPTIQQLVLTNFGRYSAESIETQFDFITAIIQEWLSALSEETRQRIATDEILNQYVVQRIDDFVQQVNQNWDDKSQEIEDYIATIMPSFTQTLREEIEDYAVAGMQDAIDQTLAESKAELDDAVAELDDAVALANAAATAVAIAGKVYDTPEAGVDPVTGVADGAYFNVRSSSDESYVDEYQNVGGSAVATGKSYPSNQGVDKKISDSVAIKFLKAAEIGLMKWTDFKKPPYTAQEYEQAYNNGIRLAAAIKAANDAGYGEVVLERGNYPFIYSNLTTSIYSYGGAMVIDGVRDIDINFNGSTLFVLFDSTTKHQFITAPTAAINGAGRYCNNIILEQNTRNVKFKNATFRGDEYMRTWVTNEYITDDTQAHCRYKNCVNTRWENIKYTGFRADGINGNPIGDTVINWAQMEVWNSGDIVNGVVAAKVGAYHTNKLDMQGKNIIDNTVALRATAYPGGFIKFGSHLIKVVFYDASSNFISSETTAQTRRISLPLNCRYIQFVGYGIPATTPTHTFERYISVDTGVSWWSTVRDCEFFEIHRGGIANLGGGTLIDSCKFKDIGFSKLGFPNYGDTTIYAINFEDSYDDNLTVRDCEIDNMKQGVLFNGIDLKVKGCTFRNLEFMGVSPYGAASSIITGNTFENVWNVLNIARTAMTQRKKVIFSENTCKDSGLFLTNILDNPVHKVFILNNIWDGTKSRYISSGSGGLFEISASKNVNFSGNLLQNLPDEGVFGIRFQNLAKMSDNTFIFDGSADRTQLRLFNITDGHANTVRTQSDSTTPESDFLTSGQIINFKGFDFIGSRGYKIVRTNKSKGWVDHEDVVEIRDCKFDGGNLIAEGFDGQNFYDLKVKQVGGSYMNGAYFNMRTRETSAYAGSTCDVVFDGVTFDVTTATRVFETTYALIGTVNIQFQNCTFVSDTVKSLAFIQGHTANVTATAINCRFLNVTNTDSILQIAGTAKINYAPPSLATAAQQSTSIILTGAKLGDNVNVSFDKPLSGTRMWGEVTLANTVTIYHRNDTGAAVDVPNGTLTVKIV